MDVRPHGLSARLTAWVAAGLAAVALALVAAPVAGAAEDRISARQAVAAANQHPVASELARDHAGLSRRAALEDDAWEVSLYAEAGGEGERVGLVIVDARDGEVREAWTGDQVAWRMARGYSGAFGRSLNAPYIFLPLCALFLIGLVDWRRPLRPVNLDLAVLLAFGISHIYFNRGEIGVSVPLAYPVLAYLAARLAWIGFRGGGPGIRPVWPTQLLVLGTLFLVGLRAGLNIFDSGVIDVGYASVVGADRLGSGEAPYGGFPEDVAGGDTYGPFTYLAYLPFELALPWSGGWDSLPAAHAAAIAFDLGVLGLLVLMGRQLRSGEAGTRLGVTMAFGWAAYPYTAFVLSSNSNDTLVGLLLLGALCLGARPAARGAVGALAVLTKFAPLVAIPILMRLRPPPPNREDPGAAAASLGGGDRPAADRGDPGALASSHGDVARSARGGSGLLEWLRAAGSPRRRYLTGFGIAALLLLAPLAVDPGLATLYERTIGYQAGRDSPFSIWGQADGLGPLRPVLLALIAAAALATAWRPREPGPAQVAALAAALVIAVQIAAMHWFYLYIVWFYPLALVALAAGGPGPGRPISGAFRRLERAPTPAR